MKKAGLNHTFLSGLVAQSHAPLPTVLCFVELVAKLRHFFTDISIVSSNSKHGLKGLGYQSFLTVLTVPFYKEIFFSTPATWLALQKAPYLETESLLHQQALGDPSGVGSGEGVLDIQLLAGVFKDIIADTAEVGKQLPAVIHSHQHAATVILILQRT